MANTHRFDPSRVSVAWRLVRSGQALCASPRGYLAYSCGWNTTKWIGLLATRLAEICAKDGVLDSTRTITVDDGGMVTSRFWEAMSIFSPPSPAPFSAVQKVAMLHPRTRSEARPRPSRIPEGARVRPPHSSAEQQGDGNRRERPCVLGQRLQVAVDPPAEQHEASVLVGAQPVDPASDPVNPQRDQERPHDHRERDGQQTLQRRERGGHPRTLPLRPGTSRNRPARLPPAN